MDAGSRIGESSGVFRHSWGNYPNDRRSDMQPLFIDIQPLSQDFSDQVLEFIYKAHGHEDAGIWSPHESLLLRRMIELFSQRGLDRLQAVKDELIAWETGALYKESPAKITMPGMMERWNEHELGLVRIYLEHLFPGEWTLDDHMLAIEYVTQKYLPADALKTEAEWLATKATLMGKVQANMAAAVTDAVADKLLAGLPGTIAEAVSAFSLPAQQKAALQFASAKAVENVRSLTDDVRHRMRGAVLQHLQEQQTMAAGVSMPSLETKLFDQFAALNRDWRRISVTEAGEAQTQGYIASLPPGTKVKRVEVYASACGFCKKINGKIATVVSADHPDKDPDTMVWPGKSNVGRSAAPMKRVGNVLVPRSPEELFWLPAGLAHPHCRGRWVPVAEDQPGDDPDFAEWIRDALS